MDRSEWVLVPADISDLCKEMQRLHEQWQSKMDEDTDTAEDANLAEAAREKFNWAAANYVERLVNTPPPAAREGRSPMTKIEEPLTPMTFVFHPNAVDPQEVVDMAKAGHVVVLQNHIRREEDCRTLDDWRMRAYDLEKRWSDASRHCSVLADEIDRLKAKVAELESLLAAATERPPGWRAP